MTKVDCTIIYVKVADKLVPEIIEDIDEAIEFLKLNKEGEEK